MQTNTQLYFKPWICVLNLSSTDVNATTLSNREVVTIPIGYTLPSGIYTFEFRFIAHRCIFPVTLTYNVHGTYTFDAAVSTVSANDACSNPEAPTYPWTIISSSGQTMCDNVQIRSNWLDIYGPTNQYFWLYNGTNVREFQVLLSNQGYYFAIPYYDCTTCSAPPPPANCELAGTAVYS
jgi:hypothetical protein